VAERLLVEWRIEGERMIHSLGSACHLDGDLLSAKERAEMEPCIAGLRRAIQGTDFLSVKAWIETANAESEDFAERRMSKHIARAMAGHGVEEFEVPPRPPPPGSPGSEDE
jgi:molecular chaperone HscA